MYATMRFGAYMCLFVPVCACTCQGMCGHALEMLQHREHFAHRHCRCVGAGCLSEIKARIKYSSAAGVPLQEIEAQSQDT